MCIIHCDTFYVPCLNITLPVCLDFDTQLSTSQKHLKRRKLADEHYRLNAQRMKCRYNSKNVHTFLEGDIVALRIPRIDRAATDMHRLTCVVVQRHGKKHFLYRLQCEYGLLNSCYPGSELEAHSGSLQLQVQDWRSAPRVTLREAAKRANPENTYYGSFCSCKGDCSGKKCSCKQARKPCSTRCHSGRSCVNHRDEIVPKPSPPPSRQADSMRTARDTARQPSPPPSRQADSMRMARGTARDTARQPSPPPSRQADSMRMARGTARDTARQPSPPPSRQADSMRTAQGTARDTARQPSPPPSRQADSMRMARGTARDTARQPSPPPSRQADSMRTARGTARDTARQPSPPPSRQADSMRMARGTARDTARQPSPPPSRQADSMRMARGTARDTARQPSPPPSRQADSMRTARGTARDTARQPSPPPSTVIDVDSLPTPPPTDWWLQPFSLKAKDKHVLDSGAWLNDLHISAAQKILHGDFSGVGSLQSSVLGSKQMFAPVKANSVQILNYSGHWGCVSTIDCKPGHVNVYDSLYPTPPTSLVRQLCCLLRTNEKTLEVHMMDMQTQSGLNDCGCFAIACATALCYGQNPSRIHWTQNKMREHLATCLTESKLTPFPSRRIARSVPADIKQTLTFPVFCKCRMLEDRKGMLRCIQCMEWYHQKCCNIPRSAFKAATWMCGLC